MTSTSPISPAGNSTQFISPRYIKLPFVLAIASRSLLTPLLAAVFGGTYYSRKTGYIVISMHHEGEFYTIDGGVETVTFVCECYNFQTGGHWFEPSKSRSILCGSFYNGIQGQISVYFPVANATQVFIRAYARNMPEARGANCTIAAYTN